MTCSDTVYYSLDKTSTLLFLCIFHFFQNELMTPVYSLNVFNKIETWTTENLLTFTSNHFSFLK